MPDMGEGHMFHAQGHVFHAQGHVYSRFNVFFLA